MRICYAPVYLGKFFRRKNEVEIASGTIRGSLRSPRLDRGRRCLNPCEGGEICSIIAAKERNHVER